MIFAHEKETGKLTAVLEADDSTQVYQCLPTVCMNPVCDCNDVFLKFERSGETHNIGINLEDKTLIERDNVSTIDAFAAQVFDLLDESDFKILKNVYWTHKQIGTETADFSQLKVEFPKDDIERDGILIIYNKVLPYANRFEVTIGGMRYIAEDQYCVRNKCHCTETLLCLYPLINVDADAYTEVEPVDLALITWVDCQSKKWVPDDKSRVGQLNIMQTRSALENRYQNLYDIVRQRHQRLKLLYNNYLKTLPSEKSQKVGRNESCPCGSGKKYKKCCGSNSAFLA